jgi:hypothetical protein
VLHVLVAVVAIVLAYHVTIWVLGMVGIRIPDLILTIAFVLLALLAVIGAISGKWDNWWKPTP